MLFNGRVSLHIKGKMLKIGLAYSAILSVANFRATIDLVLKDAIIWK